MTTETPRLSKVLIPVVILVVLAVSALTLVKFRLGNPGDTSSSKDGTSPAIELAVGATVPDLSLHRFAAAGGEAARPAKLSSIPAKVYLVNFWATWCEACMVEMPSILDLKRSFGNKGLEVVFVSVDEKPEAVLPRTIRDLKIDFPVYTDVDQELSGIFDVHAIPLTVVMDAQRKVLMIQNGELDWNSAEVRRKMEQWLKG